MANRVGPTWGSEVAAILMQGGQWKQTKELQESSQEHDEQMRKLENLMQVKNEYTGKMFDVVMQAAEEGNLDNPAMKPFVSEVVRAFESQLGVDPGSIDAEMFAAVLPSLITEESKQQKVGTRIAEATEEDVIAQAGQRTEAGEQALDKGAIELILGERAAERDPADYERRVRSEEAGIATEEARATAIEKETEWLDETLGSRVELNTAQARRLNAEADLLVKEMMGKAEGVLDPDMMKAVNERARIRFLGVKAGDEDEVELALHDVMLMYEEAGWPLPTTLVWEKDDRSKVAAFFRRLWGGTQPFDTYSPGEETRGTEILGPKPGQPGYVVDTGQTKSPTDQAEDEAAMNMFNVPTGPEDQ